MSAARRIALLVFDLAALLWLLSVRLQAWPREKPRGIDAGIPEAWWEYGALHDTILAGPDAGAWAANVQSLLHGQPLDIHRLPTFTYLAAAATRLFDDVVFAGHFVNHVLSVMTVLITYLWGRSTSGRAAALAGAALTALSPELVESQFHYGVDPGLQWSVMLLAATSWMGVAGRAPWVLAAGAAAGLAAGTHFLTLIFIGQALLLLLIADRAWWGRILGLALAIGAGWLTWKWLLTPYPSMTKAQVLSVFAEGVSGSGGRDMGESLSFAQAVERVLLKVEGAPTMAVARGLAGLSIGKIPWGVLVAFFWLGILGPTLKPWKNRLSWDWRPTLWFAAFLAPLVALEAARAPDRYALYARPFLFLCVARGAASLGALLDALLRRYWGRWPSGIIGFLPALWVVHGLWGPMKADWDLYPPTEKGLLLRKGGAEVVAQFGAGGGIATFNRDFAFHAERQGCMNVPCQGDSPVVLGQCLERLRLECRGDGPIPYVIEIRDRRGFGDQPNAALDQLVSERFEKVGSWVGREITLELYSLDRTALQALAKELAGSKLQVAQPPPPGGAP